MISAVNRHGLVSCTLRARDAAQKNGSFVDDRPFDCQVTWGWINPRPYGPERFTWGRVVQIHRVGDYQIVEFHPNPPGTYKPFEMKYRPVEDRLSFHPYVDGKDCGRSFSSLDMALLGCVAWRADIKRGGFNEAANSSAVLFMARMIGLKI